MILQSLSSSLRLWCTALGLSPDPGTSEYGLIRLLAVFYGATDIDNDPRAALVRKLLTATGSTETNVAACSERDIWRRVSVTLAVTPQDPDPLPVIVARIAFAVSMPPTPTFDREWDTETNKPVWDTETNKPVASP